ncbi:calcium-binding protein [Litorimonas sp. WD9-15]|uniref:calcium-binding protein n=1 Tax=Litorimonas sp. WD9-15 TaxID=3418716 RepID=UPI003CFEF0AC
MYRRIDDFANEAIGSVEIYGEPLKAIDFKNFDSKLNGFMRHLENTNVFFTPMRVPELALNFRFAEMVAEDDFTDNSTTTGSLDIDGMAEGVINFEGDSDWFEIELTVGDVIRIAVDDTDVNLSLRDKSGNFIAFDFRDFDTNENLIVMEVVDGGTFYVDARSFTSPLNYTLTATTIEDDFLGNSETSGTLEVGATATGSIEYRGDSDWFAIELVAGETIRIASDDIDTVISLRDEFGNFVASNYRDFDTNESVIIAQVDANGTFYVDVESFNSTVNYVLTATEIEDDFSGNNDTTGILEVGGTATGSIDYRFDPDWFAIELVAGETIRIASNGTDTNLSLRDELGNLIASDFRDFDTDQSVIIAQLDQTGTYYIDVSSFTSPLDYTLTATVIEDDFVDDADTTGSLDVSGTATGSIDYRNDSDWFAIELTAGDIVRIASNDTDANLTLRNEFGGAVASNFRNFETNESVIIAQVEESGTFYVDVSSFESSLNYTLTASEIDDDFSDNVDTTGVLELGNTARGTINYRDDSDWFAIELAVGDIVRIAVNDIDLNMSLRDESGNRFGFNFRDFDTDEAVIIFDVEESGTFYIDVNGFSPPLNYTLTADVLDDDFSDDTTTTGILEVDGTASGSIDFRNDEDWFAIDLVAGETVRIASNNVDANLTLLDASGNSVAFDFRNFDTNENVLIAQVDESGAFYINVNSFSSPQDYTLTSTVIEDSFSDDSNTTGVLELGGTATGSIDFRNDSDWFAIDLTAGDIIRIASNDTNTDLFLRDGSGNFLAFDFRDFNTNESVIETLVEVTGTFYVDVRGSTSPLDYTLTAVKIEDDFSGDTETLGTLEIGGTSMGSVDFRNDSDWFAINLTVGDTIRIASDNTSANLILRDEFGNFVASDFRDFETSENVIIAQVDVAGTFFVDVSSSSAPLDYTLTATEIEDDFSDDENTTGVLEVGGTAMGSINFRNDNDWFAIELTAGQLVRITSDGFEADLDLRGLSGEFFATEYLDFDNGETVILVEVEESQTVYVVVDSFESSLDYTLSAAIQEDDFSNNTETTGVLEVGATSIGRIDFRNDEDWFAIELTAGEIIRIASNDTDASLTLRDEAGIFVASDYRDFGANESVIIAQVQENGIYYIGVDSFDAPLDYTLTASVQEDDFAANIDTTGVLEAEGTATGSIEYRADSDWFAIELTAGEFIRIAADSDDVNLVLRDESGESVAFDFRDVVTNENVIIAQAEQSGTFYVDVSSFNASIDYTLNATVLEDDFAADTDTAGILEIGSSSAGVINFRGDSDWFAVELTAGEQVRFTSEDVTTSLVLRDEFGNFVASNYRDREADEPVLVYEAEESGTFFVDVSTLRYSLDYTVTASIQEDDFRANTDTTGTLEAGGRATGVIDFKDDADWFAIEITDTDLDLRLFVDSPRVSLSLYDANGNLLRPSIDDTTISFSEAGTYYISAFESFFDAGDYTISSVIVDSVDANLPVTNAGIVDTVVDDANAITYSLSDDGILIRYSTETGTLLPETDLGVDTSALSLSQDGQYLFAAQADLTDVGNNVFEATVLRIDTETLAVESFSFEVSGQGYEITDIQAAADGSLFVTTNFPGSGWVPFYNLSGFDDILSVNVIDDDEFSGFNGVRQNTTLDISRDGQFLLMAESNISSYPVHIYSVETGEVIASTNHGGFNFDKNAISGAAQLVAVAGYNEVTLYDFDLNPVADLTGIYGNAERVDPIFSKNGEYLFLVNDAFNGDSSIAVISTSTYEVVSFVDVAENISSISDVDLSPDGLSIIVTNQSGVRYFDFSETDLSLNGTEARDRLFGTEFDELITGLAGNDILNGRAGDDTLLGGEGNDMLIGGAGDDTISGESGDDRILAGSGDDIVEGGAGVDDILGGSGNDFIFGGDGDDLIDGQANNDIIEGGAGRDTIFGGNGNDLIKGQSGNDALRGGDGNDRVEGGTGNDFLGGAGGHDLLIGGTGHDRLYGGSGQDTLFGQQGNDLLVGGGGNDRLVGAAGNDVLDGQAGDDILEGGSANDNLTGGSGADTFVLSRFAATTTVTDFTDGVDVLDLSDFSDTDIANALDGAVQQNSDTVLTFANGSVLVLENFDLIDLSDEDVLGYDASDVALMA